MSEIREEVISFIAQKLKNDPSRIHESSYFMADLGLSSLRSLELICDLEAQFGLRIPDHEIPTLLQVQNLIVLIEQKKEKPGCGLAT